VTGRTVSALETPPLQRHWAEGGGADRRRVSSGRASRGSLGVVRRQWRSRGRLVVKRAKHRALRTEDRGVRHPRLRHRPGGSPRHKPKRGL